MRRHPIKHIENANKQPDTTRPTTTENSPYLLTKTIKHDSTPSRTKASGGQPVPCTAKNTAKSTQMYPKPQAYPTQPP